MKRILLFLLLTAPLWSTANDGVYYVNGNHLIPITETDISVRKEVLTITRVGSQCLVDVYYEFFNPAAAKTLLVGFEAADPYPCYDPEIYEKAYPNHPFIFDFTVEMNGKRLDYEVAHVDNFKPSNWNERTGQPEYYRDGKFVTIDVKEYLDTLRENEYYMAAGIYYAYHFQAHFQPGLNIIHHTYRYELSVVAGYNYYLPYVLTAANRWANHQIDDFTLILDMGDRQSFFVQPYFYDSINEWKIEGAGRMHRYTDEGVSWDSIPSIMFHIRQGKAVFHKDNFHPKGELYIYNPRSFYNPYSAEKQIACFSPYYSNPWEEYLTQEEHPDDLKSLPYTREERRILRNLPFAQRGYCFKNAQLQNFYNATNWYTPDSSYTPDLETLSPEERRWVEFWSEK